MFHVPIDLNSSNKTLHKSIQNVVKHCWICNCRSDRTINQWDKQLKMSSQIWDRKRWEICCELTLWWWWETCSTIWIPHKQHSMPRCCWWMPSGTQRLPLQLRTALMPPLPTLPRSPWWSLQRRLPQHLHMGEKSAAVGLDIQIPKCALILFFFWFIHSS